jgi:hypothetical protein
VAANDTVEPRGQIHLIRSVSFCSSLRLAARVDTCAMTTVQTILTLFWTLLEFRVLCAELRFASLKIAVNVLESRHLQYLQCMFVTSLVKLFANCNLMIALFRTTTAITAVPIGYNINHPKPSKIRRFQWISSCCACCVSAQLVYGFDAAASGGTRLGRADSLARSAMNE